VCRLVLETTAILAQVSRDDHIGSFMAPANLANAFRSSGHRSTVRAIPSLVGSQSPASSC
jgi:hypothetical protein